MNEALLALSAGDKSSNIVSLVDEKKHPYFLSKDHARCYEGLKLAVYPSLRKGAIGHAAVPPLSHLARAMPWGKIGQTSVDYCTEMTSMLFGKS